jgi:hypothetical protein
MCQHVPPSRYPASMACYTAPGRSGSAEPARSLLTELFRRAARFRISVHFRLTYWFSAQTRHLPIYVP